MQKRVRDLAAVVADTEDDVARVHDNLAEGPSRLSESARAGSTVTAVRGT